MNITNMSNGSNKTLFHRQTGQSLVEFALILPLFVLFIVGIFELGRAFFAYIAISNAAREGARVATFWPGKTTVLDVQTAVKNELASAPTIDVGNLKPIQIDCGSPPPPNTVYKPVTTNAELKACPSMNPIRVTVTYKFDFILKIFLPSLDLKRSAEMMIP